jgi:glycosyltransferase involved in cell wall biosynthesis
MPERLLARYYRAVDLVLDQFQLGVFGLITPKAMACGAAVLTSYDDRHNAWCFPTAPPVVPCFSRDEIASAILRLSSDHEARRTIGAASREWVKRHHSSERVTHYLEKAMASAGGVFAKRRFAA